MNMQDVPGRIEALETKTDKMLDDGGVQAHHDFKERGKLGARLGANEVENKTAFEARSLMRDRLDAIEKTAKALEDNQNIQWDNLHMRLKALQEAAEKEPEQSRKGTFAAPDWTKIDRDTVLTHITIEGAQSELHPPITVMPGEAVLLDAVSFRAKEPDKPEPKEVIVVPADGLITQVTVRRSGSPGATVVRDLDPPVAVKRGDVCSFDADTATVVTEQSAYQKALKASALFDCPPTRLFFESTLRSAAEAIPPCWENTPKYVSKARTDAILKLIPEEAQ